MVRDSKSIKGKNVSCLQNIQSVSGTIKPRAQWVVETFLRLQLPGYDVPKLRMSGTIHSLLLHVFMAWSGKNLLYLYESER
jgi:hypothetical protein